MGMSTIIQGFIPDTDETYQKHKKVLLACNEADVSLPTETADYFGYNYPELCALEEKLEFKLIKGVHYSDFNENMVEGFEIDIRNLPKSISKIRFYNSY